MEEIETKVGEASENGTCMPEDIGEAVPSSKEEEKNGIKEIEEDKKVDENAKALKVDENLTLKKDKESKQKEAKEDEEETVNMEEEIDVKGEEEKTETSKEEKASPKRRKRQSIGKEEAKKREIIEEKVNEPTTPVASSLVRPVRERKSVDRLVASIDKAAVKEFDVEEGRGTRLKDIPNVAYKLSRRKNEDSFKLLHTILFGRRGKAFHVKSNISQFSGFVWHDNEEKQRIKLKEKFDKYIKEKLFDFCNVLDIPIAKALTRKEDIVVKLVDFLAAPHATTDVLLAEKEQSSKDRKRKRVLKRNTSGSRGTSAKSKRRKSAGTSKEKAKKGESETEDKSEEEKEESENGIPDKSEDEVPGHSESEEREKKKNESEESEKDARKEKPVPKKSLIKKESAGISKTKALRTPKKATPAALPKETPSKSSSKHSKDTSPRVFSRKKKSEETTNKKLIPVKTPTKERTDVRLAKGKGKTKGDEARPSEEKLRNVICEILKEVDFNTATFTDILKKLTKHFDMDLTSRKKSIKLIIEEELTKVAEEEEENEDGDAEN